MKDTKVTLALPTNCLETEGRGPPMQSCRRRQACQGSENQGASSWRRWGEGHCGWGRREHSLLLMMCR